MIVPPASLAEPLAGKSQPVELLDHSWQLEEEWTKTRKTRYSWRARVRNHSDVAQKVSVYYYLLDENGSTVARNTMSRIVPPLQTLEINSDSYVGSSIVSLIKAGRAVVKSNPKRR